MTKQNHLLESEELMAYLDGELRPDRAAEAAAHLADCRECQKLAAELQEISRVMLAWEVEPASNQSIAATLSESLAQKPDTKKFLRHSLWVMPSLWPKAAWAISGVAALLLIAVLAVPVLYKLNLRTARAVQQGDEVRDGRVDRLNSFEHGLNDQVRSSTGSVGRLQSQQEVTEATGKSPNQTLIVRTAELGLTTREFDKTRANLDAILRKHHGYAAELKLNTPVGSARSLTATVRVPGNELDSVLAELKALGRVESESQNGEEVTQQYVDLTARIGNAQKTEQRLIEIQSERTGKLSDVLSVEMQISRVRGEIERMQAEQKRMRNQVDFASLNLTVTEDYKAELKVVPPSTSTQIRNAAVEGYRSLVDSLLALLLWCLSLLPSLLVWAALLFFPVRFGWRKLRTRTAQ